MHKDKKPLRFHTDYNDYDHIYTTNVHPINKLNKPVDPSHRRDTFDCAIDDKIIKTNAVQSTKYNPGKNI